MDTNGTDNWNTSRFLNHILKERKTKNPGYSLRALARDLQLSVTSLSLIINGKRAPSLKFLKNLQKNISISPLIYDQLEQECSEPYTELDLKVIESIQDWYFFAILSLMEIPKFQSSPKWIGERLNIKPKQAENALKILAELGFIKNESGKYVLKDAANYRTPSNIPARSIRKSHLQGLDLAKKSLEEIPVKYRHFSASTLAIKKDKVQEVHDKIFKFRRSLGVYLDSGQDNDAVYRLSVQLFPLSKL